MLLTSIIPAIYTITYHFLSPPWFFLSARGEANWLGDESVGCCPADNKKMCCLLLQHIILNTLFYCRNGSHTVNYTCPPQKGKNKVGFEFGVLFCRHISKAGVQSSASAVFLFNNRFYQRYIICYSISWNSISYT